MTLPPETLSDDDTLTLAASDRLARALREQRHLALRAQGATVWEAPRIQSLRQWMQDVWTANWPNEQLLHSAQELALWRDVIDHDADGQSLLAPMAAAREARRADQLVLRHGLDLARWRLQSGDHAVFQRWRRALRGRMRKQQWITASDLPELVAAAIERGEVKPPRRIELAGFIETPTRSERRVLDALRAAGAEVEHLSLPHGEGCQAARRHADAESQFRAIAIDIRERLRSETVTGTGTSTPPQIVLALPDPAARRGLIESVFRPVLAPWLQQVQGQRVMPWRWDGGQPLIEHPQIAAALVVCALAREGNDPALISRLLLSPVLWSEDECEAAAVADARLRDEGWPRLSLRRVLEALSGATQAAVARLDSVIAAAQRRALPSAWAQHFRGRLTALGWPGHVDVDSSGFQAQRDWERLLTRLSAMDAQVGKLGAGQALAWLRELARSARFEPRVEYAQPLLIVALEDAVALPCDVLYLADLAADRFPPRVSASSYLPLELQSAAAVPGADPAQTLERARRLAAHLGALADEVHLSYAAIDERGADVNPSPLFVPPQGWVDADAPRRVSGLDRLVASGRRSLTPADDPIPAVDPREAAQLRPNLNLFKAWQESPFFAFCQFRLGIEPLRRPSRGLDARRQGQAVHAVLQALWSQLGDSAGLARADAPRLRADIAVLLREALDAHMPVVDYGRAQVELEYHRLADVLAQWMEHERERIDPFTVAIMEAPTQAHIGGLDFRLRVDRVDRVDFAGEPRWLVLDYKTGAKADPKGWNVDKLSEPQLPLYASHAVLEAAGVPRVDGICFAHLKDGHPALSAETNWRKKLREPELADTREAWDSKLRLWRDQLSSVAQAFLRGEAGIAPKVSDRSFYADLLLLVGREGDDSEPV